MDSGLAFGGLTGYRKLRASETSTFRLFLPDWVNLNRPGTYKIQLSGRLRVQETGVEAATKARELQLDVSATLEVLPPDHEKLGVRIDALAKDIQKDGADESAREALKMLGAIRDERVIPHLLREVRTRKYHLKAEVLHALGQFNSDEALKGLEEGMKITAADLDDIADRESAEAAADLLRYSAAGALSESPHPGAVRLLLFFRNDRSSAVRGQVIKGVARKTSSLESVPILRQMAKDPEKAVRESAGFYLNSILSERQ